ncbi:BTAD domain-containing putative transcriptional regulator [Salinifilum ghardaiensis]
MRFGVLGPLAVWTEEGAAVTVPGRKVRALLACLLVRPGRGVPAERLVDDLWGAAAPRDPAAALQAKVSQLRRALGSAEAGARGLVVSTDAGYRLDAAPEAVDAGRFTALLTSARALPDPAQRAAALGEALALWRGPAFAEFTEDAFARAAIEELTEQWLAAVEDRVDARLALGEHHALVPELGRLLDEHPLRERLHAAHMRALYRCGRQAEALETYSRLRTRLAEELGLDPGPELTELQQAVLAHDPGLQGEQRSGADSGAAVRTNLPAPFGPLVGRESAAAELSRELDSARLVTLTGPGGVGKTRLALEVAARRAAERPDALPDGVWVVDLAAFDPTAHTDAVGALADLVGSTLGVRDDVAAAAPPPGEPCPAAERLAQALAPRHVLLVLDNCEHAVEPVARITAALLAAAPRLQVLATSREPVGLAGERLQPVPPLVLPEPEADEAEVDAAGRSAAVELFVARAAAAVPGFRLTPDNARAITSICRQLDGLPLAVELAVTRVRALGVHDLAVRLCDRFQLLTAGHRDAPARQRTLRAMIDWSWELLDEGERAVLRRLSAHGGDCALDSAEAVCAGEDVPSGQVAGVLARLVDRSLVAVSDTAGGRRYRLLETIAAYARERLDEAGEAERVQLRHARYYADLTERADHSLRGPEQRHWLQRLDTEAANLRTALATTVHHCEPALALRLATAAAWYWFLRGTYRQAHRSLDLAVSMPGEAPATARADATAWRAVFGALIGTDPAPLRESRSALALHNGLDEPAALARAQWLLGFVGGLREQEAAEELVDQALRGFRELDDRWGVAAALYTQADQAVLHGDLDEARRLGQQAAAMFAELDDRWGQAQTAKVLGMLAEIAGEYERSARLHQEALRNAEELGLWPTASEQLSRLGRLALLAGDHRAADAYHHRALRLAHEHSHEGGANFARGGLGLSARRQGLLDDAEDYLRPALSWERHIGYQVGQAWVLAQLGFTAEQRGEVDTARGLHLDGLAAARATGDPRAVALALEGLAGVRTLAGDHEHAAALLAAAAARRDAVHAPLPPAERGDVDRIAQSVREHLDEAAQEAARHRGETAELGALLGPLTGEEERSGTA